MLKHKFQIRTGEVDEELVEEFASIDMVPAFSFIDPFGYKGVTLELLEALVIAEEEGLPASTCARIRHELALRIRELRAA